MVPYVAIPSHDRTIYGSSEEIMVGPQSLAKSHILSSFHNCFSFSWFYADCCFLFVERPRSLAKNRIHGVSSLSPFYLSNNFYLPSKLSTVFFCMVLSLRNGFVWYNICVETNCPHPSNHLFSEKLIFDNQKKCLKIHNFLISEPNWIILFCFVDLE